MFPLTIAAVNKTHFEGDAQSVTVPGSEGELTILKEHESLISVLKRGTITIRTKSDSRVIEIEQGILEVHQGGVTVLL